MVYLFNIVLLQIHENKIQIFEYIPFIKFQF